MKQITKIAAALGLLALMPTAAYADDWQVTGKVTMVEATGMPGTLFFAIDTDTGTCPAGTYFTWNAHGPDTATQAQNSQAAFALLLTAKSTGQVIRMIGNNSNGCNVDVLYLGSVDRR